MLLGTWQFWWTRAHIRDGRRWGERVLAREADLSPLGRARALAFHSAMSFWQGDYNAALPGFVEAAQIFEQQEDKAGIAITDLALGLVQGFLGDFEAGSERIDRGRRLYEEMGDSFGIVGALNALGWLQATFGRFDESDEMIRRAIEIAQELESQADVGLAQINLARWLLRHERVDEAIAELRSSLDLLSSLRHHGATANVIDIVVEVAAVRRDWEGVLTLAGAAETIRGRLGAENPQPGAERLAEVAAQARAQLPADVADRAWAAGCALDLDGSVDAARSLLGVADRAAQPA
ncbi:MAG TPA: hypothetical protein VHL59_07815 [Thermoanaerobaculia bacterium]|nr:hypothetical protein [Thermoanaerobaculia bacterium]